MTGRIFQAAPANHVIAPEPHVCMHPESCAHPVEELPCPEREGFFVSHILNMGFIPRYDGLIPVYKIIYHILTLSINVVVLKAPSAHKQ